MSGRHSSQSGSIPTLECSMGSDSTRPRSSSQAPRIAEAHGIIPSKTAGFFWAGADLQERTSKTGWAGDCCHVKIHSWSCC
jgi:hypothetical protein